MESYTMHASNGGVRPIESDTGEWVRLEDIKKSIVLELNGAIAKIDEIVIYGGGIKVVAHHHDSRFYNRGE